MARVVGSAPPKPDAIHLPVCRSPYRARGKPIHRMIQQRQRTSQRTDASRTAQGGAVVFFGKKAERLVRCGGGGAVANFGKEKPYLKAAFIVFTQLEEAVIRDLVAKRVFCCHHWPGNRNVPDIGAKALGRQSLRRNGPFAGSCLGEEERAAAPRRGTYQKRHASQSVKTR